MDDAHRNYHKYLDMQPFQWIDDLQFYVPFDHISVISGQCVGDIEMLCAMESCLRWLVGCFGLNGPLRQYFSLYRAVSQREGERKRNDSREKKCPNNPHMHLLQVQKALTLL